ncbi:MAG: hypothetical protein ACFB4I_11755 [Cyanophyceae cyanobacterium]
MVNNQPPPHFDPNDSSPPGQPHENKQARKNLKRMMFTLIAVGLCIGGVVSVGLVVALNYFGLSDPPSQVDHFGE